MTNVGARVCKREDGREEQEEEETKNKNKKGGEDGL